MPQFIKHATRKSCTTSAHSNSNYKAVFQRKTFPTFFEEIRALSFEKHVS